MRVVISDIYIFGVRNAKETQFPKKYRNYKIIWNMREVLLAIWEGNITHLAIPELGTPGYDFPGFIKEMVKIGQIKTIPKLEYYQFNITKKS